MIPLVLFPSPPSRTQVQIQDLRNLCILICLSFRHRLSIISKKNLCPACLTTSIHPSPLILSCQHYHLTPVPIIKEESCFTESSQNNISNSSADLSQGVMLKGKISDEVSSVFVGNFVFESVLVKLLLP